MTVPPVKDDGPWRGSRGRRLCYLKVGWTGIRSQSRLCQPIGSSKYEVDLCAQRLVCLECERQGGQRTWVSQSASQCSVRLSFTRQNGLSEIRADKDEIQCTFCGRWQGARCWPSAGLRGSQRRCHRVFTGLRVVACRCGCTEGWGSLSRLSPPVPGPRGGRGHLPYTSTGLLCQQRYITIHKVPGWHATGVHNATQVAVRAWLDSAAHWEPPCSDDPVSNSAVTGALVAGRAVT